MTKIFNNPKNLKIRKLLRKKQTETEKIVWSKLRAKKFFGIKFFRQYGIGKYIADFYCPEFKIVIEIDGSQHFQDKNYENDKIREEYMFSLGIKTIRFSNIEIKENINGVLEHVKNIIDEIIINKSGDKNERQRKISNSLE